MTKRRTTVTLCLLLAGSTAGCRRTSGADAAVATIRGDATDSAANPVAERAPTEWERLMARVQREREVPLDVALQAWAMTMGPLPGVTAPRADGSAPSCGYTSQLWVLNHWRSLSPEQQAAVERRMSGQATSSERHTVSSALAAAIPGFGVSEERCTQAQSSPWTAQERASVTALAAQLAREISERTGRPFNDRIEFRWADRRYLGGVRDGACGEVAAQVFAFRSDGVVARLLESATPIASFSTCVMEVGKLVVEQPQLARSLVGHEIAHCFQHDAFDGTVHEWAAMNTRDGDAMQYIVEGGPSWIGEELANGTDFSVGWWRAYIHGRRTHGAGRFSLLDSSYDAIGFYSHLAARGAPVWHAIIPAVNQGPHEFFDALVGSVRPETEPLSTWASSTVRQPWGDGWQAAGRAIPADARREPHGVDTLRAGSSATIAAAAMAQYVARFALQSNVRVVRVSGDGHARASFAGAGERAGNGALHWDWCVGSCQCPNGQPIPGLARDAVSVSAGVPLTIALSGSANEPTELEVSALDPCVPPSPPPPDAGQRVPLRPDQPIIGQDACLLGGWLLDTAASTVFDALRANSDIRYQGTLALSFTASEAHAAPAGFVAEYTLPSPGIGGTVVTKVFAQGGTTATWRANAGRASFATPVNGLTFALETRMGGIVLPVAPMQISAAQLPDLTPSTARYECIPQRRLTFFYSNGTRAVYRKR